MNSITAAPARLVELQSLRGLAALLVMLHHVSYYYDVDLTARGWIDSVLNAHAAIVLFFVLSGFVLSASLIRSGLNWNSAARFYVRRAFRIFPALIIATLLMVTYLLIFGRELPSNASDWAHRAIDVLRLDAVALAAATIGWPLVLPTAYTVLIELGGSVIIPPLLLLLGRSLFVAALTIVALAGLALAAHFLPGRLQWLMFGFDFAIGAVVALLPGMPPRFARIASLVAVTGLLLTRAAWMLVSIGDVLPLEVDYHRTDTAFFEAIFGAILIAAIASLPQVFGWLRSPTLVWLGDISYGVYLLHFSAMYFGAQLLGASGNLPILAVMPALLLLTTALTLLGSTILYRAVERPGIRFGKRLLGQSEAA